MFEMVTVFCDWLASIRAAGNRFEWEKGQTQMKHEVREIWNGFQAKRLQQYVAISPTMLACVCKGVASTGRIVRVVSSLHSTSSLGLFSQINKLTKYQERKYSYCLFSLLNRKIQQTKLRLALA